MRRQLLLLALLCALCGAERAAAQYYTWGSDPPQKWSAIRTPDVRMIYPDTVAGIARRTLFYIRSSGPTSVTDSATVRCAFPSSCIPRISSRTDW